MWQEPINTVLTHRRGGLFKHAAPSSAHSLIVLNRLTGEQQCTVYLYMLSKAASHVIKLCFVTLPPGCHWLPLWIATLRWMTDTEQNTAAQIPGYLVASKTPVLYSCNRETLWYFLLRVHVWRRATQWETVSTQCCEIIVILNGVEAVERKMWT